MLNSEISVVENIARLVRTATVETLKLALALPP